MGRTLCVILHYGSEEDTNKCLKSLMTEEDLDIIVSDNDPFQSFSLPKEFADNVKVFRTGGQAGYSEGNNLAVNEFLNELHDSVLILNNDTSVEIGALKLLKQCLFNNYKIGAVGPCMPFADSPNKIWACGGFVNKLTLAVGGLQPISDRAYEVDYLPGAAILTKAALWREIGGFSEKYFLAYEEVEYAFEVKKRGQKVMAVPNSMILHKVGMSSQMRPKYFYNNVRNRLIFSKYLYGNFLGFVIGSIVTTILVKGRTREGFLHRLRLWSLAIFDELFSKPLNRQRLSDIDLGHYSI